MMSPTPFPLPRRARIAVLASGRGSNLAALLHAFPPLDARGGGEHDAVQPALASVALVVSDVLDAPALARAAEAGVPARSIPWGVPSGRAAFERELQGELDAHGIDLVCLAGFMRIVSPSFVARWSGRILNVHPSLLPMYPGLDPQRRALEAGEAYAGCTVHFVDAGIDTGPCIVQRVVPVHPDDTVATLTARILDSEHLAYPEAVIHVLTGRAVQTTVQTTAQTTAQTVARTASEPSSTVPRTSTP